MRSSEESCIKNNQGRNCSVGFFKRFYEELAARNCKRAAETHQAALSIRHKIQKEPGGRARNLVAWAE